MPGYVKIGMSEQDDVGVRVRQLDNTSAPLPFEVHYAARVPDCRKVERTLHFVFGEHRRRSNREFFTIDPDLAKAVIEAVSRPFAWTCFPDEGPAADLLSKAAAMADDGPRLRIRTRPQPAIPKSGPSADSSSEAAARRSSRRRDGGA